MKRIILIMFVSVCAALWAQSIPLGEIIGDDRSIRDPLYGLTARYPNGWTVRGVTRWGDRETTIYMGPNAAPNAFSTLYYRVYAAPLPLPAAAEGYLRDEAKKRAERRVTGGLADFENIAGSFVFKQIGGHPALGYVSSYNAGGKMLGEYLVRVQSEKGIAQFLLRAPIEEIDALRPDFDAMIESVRLP
jgi:hypothetical protein